MPVGLVRMPPVDLLAEARQDFDESYDWYAERSAQAAIRFADAVDQALQRVAEDPERFAARDGVHRECPVRRFPFRIADDRILVAAVAHAKRHPRFWQDR